MDHPRVPRAGGLAPRYIVGSLPEGAKPHVGTTDIDLVIGLAIDDESDEAYRTLENKVKKAGFTAQNSFRGTKNVDGATVNLEFIYETDQVSAGKNLQTQARHRLRPRRIQRARCPTHHAGLHRA